MGSVSPCRSQSPAAGVPVGRRSPTVAVHHLVERTTGPTRRTTRCRRGRVTHGDRGHQALTVWHTERITYRRLVVERAEETGTESGVDRSQQEVLHRSA